MFEKLESKDHELTHAMVHFCAKKKNCAKISRAQSCRKQITAALHALLSEGITDVESFQSKYY